MKVIKPISYLLFIALVVIIALEVLLRIYDPFPSTYQGDDIVLPRNRKMIFTNKQIPSLDKRIVHTKNSLGFRGPEPPPNWNDHTTIIAVGGSTTECFYLSDSLTWTNLMQQQLKAGIPNVWVNNAGYQGHSTYGNFILINDYIKKLKPDYVLLLEGINEINRTDIRADESVARSSTKTTAWGWMKRHSRVVDAALKIRRRYLADNLHVTDRYYDVSRMDTEVVSDSAMHILLEKEKPLAAAYAGRLSKMIDTCLANNITPILITQPMLFGYSVDCRTGVDLSKLKIADGYNGGVMWSLLELYNDKTRQIASERGLTCIDLAAKLPKCSNYFYDVCHFTNEGSRKVSELLTENLKTVLTTLRPH